jgi:hypothetical protein
VLKNDVYARPLTERLVQLKYNIDDPSFPEKLAADMFALNVSAVKQKYGKVGSIPKFTFTRDYALTFTQVLKSLNCWLYQCADGDVSKQALFKFFNDLVEKFLVRKIVYSLPEYEKAVWG